MFSVLLFLTLANAVVAQEFLNDYDRIFQDHVSEVTKGTNRRGDPSDVLEIPGSGVIWRTGRQGAWSYDEDGSDEYLCSFLWLSIGAAMVRECGSTLPSDRVAAFNLYVERIADHVGRGAIPSRDLAWMKKAMIPTEPVSSSECTSDQDIDSYLDVFDKPEVVEYWDEFLSRPPKLLLMSRCD